MKYEIIQIEQFSIIMALFDIALIQSVIHSQLNSIYIG